MKNKKSVSKNRNPVLILVSSILILLGLVLFIASITNASSFGWWSMLIGLSGLTTIGAGVMSIIKNDPSWILLDLILPG